MQAVFSGRPGDWYYVDAQGKVQGPFEGGELVAWYSQRVLRDESLVMQLPEGEHMASPPETDAFERLGALLAAAGGAGAEEGEAEEREAEEGDEQGGEGGTEIKGAPGLTGAANSVDDPVHVGGENECKEGG